MGQFVYDDLTGCLHDFHIMQQKAQQLHLAEVLVGESKRVPQGKAGVHRPRRFDLAADAARKGDRYGGDAGCFDDPLDQSHGLVAQPSSRGQKDDVHGVLFEQTGDLRPCDVDQGLDVRRQDVAHEGEVAVVDRTQRVGRGQLMQPLEREYDIDILVRIAVVVVVVRDGQIARGRLDGNLAELGVAGRIAHIEGPVALQVHTARGDQRHAALRYLPGERRPGRIVEFNEPVFADPAIEQGWKSGEQPGKQLVFDGFYVDNAFFPYGRFTCVWRIP